ncbi:MAG: Smr/MutS family protein [Gammaproteobacteria bacterium]|nr:Smr/MutS family protein [Gammaproteobacteria bacterium]
MNKLDDDEIELFRGAIGEVKPVINDRVEIKKPAPAAVPSQLERDERQVLNDLQTGDNDPDDASLGDNIQYHRPGIQLSVLRKLRRGQFSIGGELDLHGMVSTEAKKKLSEFIKEALIRDIRCVRIIHGKGLRSSNKGPVLKPLTAKWLSRHAEVLAYCTARPIDGGSGALYVLLKK